MKKVRHVGRRSKEIPISSTFRGCEHVLLDIDPLGAPDTLCDARRLGTLPPAGYDAQPVVIKTWAL